MIKLRGFLPFRFYDPVLSAMVRGGTKVWKRGAPILAKTATKHVLNKRINVLNKRFTRSEGWAITITNNEINDIIKVVKSLEN